MKKFYMDLFDELNNKLRQTDFAALEKIKRSLIS